MTSLSSSNVLRGLVHAAAIAPVALFSLACLVGGERAEGAECPTGETCSAATPSGLTFVPLWTFDVDARDGDLLALDPIATGGHAEVGLLGLAGEEGVLAHGPRVEDGTFVSIHRAEGEFGGRYGATQLDVDDHVVLTGVAAGTTSLRIVDPETEELYDRVALRVADLHDVAIVPARRTRDHLLAGCTSLVGVQLLSAADERVIDDRMAIASDESATITRASWDVVRVTPSESAREVRFTIHAAGRDFERTLAVRTLADDGLASCPVE